VDIEHADEVPIDIQPGDIPSGGEFEAGDADDIRPVEGPYCNGREWLTRHYSETFSPSKGIAVTHHPQGTRSQLKRNGRVLLEGTSKNEISVTVDLKSTSRDLVAAMDISIVNGNEIVIIVFILPQSNY
jgi:hypothetical protein